MEQRADASIFYRRMPSGVGEEAVLLQKFVFVYNVGNVASGRLQLRMTTEAKKKGVERRHSKSM